MGVLSRRCWAMRWPLSIMALGASSTGGCSPEAALPSTVTRDSLAITITESTSPSWTDDSAWHLADVPVLDLVETGTGESHNFFQVRDFARLSSDRLLVVDGGSRAMRVYDARGRFVRSLGRRGEGPGEFRIFPMVDILGDGRIVARDYLPGGQAGEFTLDAGLIGTFLQPMGVLPMRQRVRGEHLWGVADVGSWNEEAAGFGLKRSEVLVGRLHDLVHLDTLAVLVGDEVIGTLVGDAVPLMGRRLAVVPDGNGDLIVGTADAMEYSKIDGDSGEVRSIVRIQGIDLTATRREVDNERRMRLGGNPSPVTRELIESLPVPRTKPAYEQLIVDEGGNVWAGEFLGLARRNDSRRWYVWDQAGMWLGVVRTPARFQVFRIGTDEILGVWRDVNDVEHPQVLRLRRANPTSLTGFSYRRVL